MSAEPSPAFSHSADFADPGSLLVEEQRLALVPGWVIGADLSDAAFRVYSLLLRYGSGSGCRMPSRRLLAERLHRSVDSVDRAMHELEAQRIVRVEQRRRGRVNLTNRYHLRTSDPAMAQPQRSNGGRKSAATPDSVQEGGRTFAATPGRTDAATVAADLRPDRKTITDTPPPLPSTPVTSLVDREERLLAECGIADLQQLADRCAVLRRQLGQPTIRWAAPCLLAAIQLAVTVRHWPARHLVPALLAVAADPSTRSPMRLAEAGPWWDLTKATDHAPTDPTELADLEHELVEVGGRRPVLQAQARTELTAEGLPLIRSTVTRRAVDILHRENGATHS